MPAETETTYGHLLESLPLDPKDLLKFKFPADAQERLAELLDQKQAGRLDEESSAELGRYLAAEAVVRVLKAKALLAAQARP